MPTTHQLSATKQLVSVDCRISGADNVVVLPPLSQVRSSIKFIKKIKADTSGYTVTIEPSSGDSLEGVVNGTITLISPGDGVLLVPSATQGWEVFAGYGPIGSGGSSIITPPGNVTGITVSNASINPSTLMVTLTVNCTAPTDPGDTITQGFLYAEIPDQSSGPAFTVGSTPLNGSATLLGPWSPIAAGTYPIAQLVSGITITFPGPSGLNIPRGAAVSCRLYIDSSSDTYQNPLVQANQSSPTPSATFPLSQAAVTSSSGTNVTNYNTTTGPVAIAATALSPVNVTGKLETPVVVTVTNTPTIRGWVYRLVLTYAGQDPTLAANQQVVAAGPFTQAGIVGQSLYELAGADGISVPHSFVLPTPTVVTNATVWLQAGLMIGGAGHTPTQGNTTTSWNNIVPGITPSFPITYGSTTGTTDASALMAATIAASMSVVSGLFGVATAGITNSLLGSAAVGTINVQNLAVTNPLLASLAVQAANLAGSSVTSTALATSSVTAAAIAALAVGSAAIQAAAITNALIANLAVSGAQIQSATITGANIASATIAGANIASATITDANIADLNVSKLLTGTLTTATITITNGLLVTANSVTTTITNVSTTVNGFTFPAGLHVQDSSSNFGFVASTYMGIDTSSLGLLFGGVVSGVGPYWLGINAVTGNVFQIWSAGLQIGALPSSSSGLAVGQFWYDPSDSNRVKYVP